MLPAPYTSSRVVLVMTLLPAIAGFGQTRDYLSELAAARQEVVQTEFLTIQKSDLGEPHPGKKRFTWWTADS